MSDVDLSGLRAPFTADQIGKLPKINCKNCSKGSCGEHKKEKCPECGNFIGKHIHIDFVGHADVTGRLLDVDPEWDWTPIATDPDPDILKAAIASGNPEIVRMVISNAPPRLERNDRGIPVGLWMRLKVGDTNRIGFGSVPATQLDPEKVLIGDAVRNAAMRGGTALEQWQKGDRADPAAENSTGSDKSEQYARSPEQPRGKVTRPVGGQDSTASPVIPEEWQKRIGELEAREDGDKARADLSDAVRVTKTVSPAMGNVILKALKAKVAALPAVEAGA